MEEINAEIGLAQILRGQNETADAGYAGSSEKEKVQEHTEKV